jgi:hypothetical protein
MCNNKPLNPKKRIIEKVNEQKSKKPKVEQNPIIDLSLSTEQRTGLIFGSLSKLSIPTDLPRLKTVKTIQQLINQIKGKYVVKEGCLWNDFLTESRKGGSYMGREYDRHNNPKKFMRLEEFGVTIKELDTDVGLFILDCLIGIKVGCMTLFLMYLVNVLKKHYPQNSNQYLIPFIQLARLEQIQKIPESQHRFGASLLLMDEIEKICSGRLSFFLSIKQIFTREAFHFIYDLDNCDGGCVNECLYHKDYLPFREDALWM